MKRNKKHLYKRLKTNTPRGLLKGDYGIIFVLFMDPVTFYA